MSKTVILLNPYGTDVTPFINHTSGYAQLLNGTVAAPSDTVYTLPYNNNVSTSANITTGAGLLDTKLHQTTGQVLVFGYSEGCQIADLWLTTYGPTTTVSPSNVSFLLIGNADNKYGGFAYNRSVFNSVGYNGGKPDATPFTVTDFVRQYDPIGDFPSAAAIVNALTGLSSASTSTSTLQAISNILASGPYSNTMTNCLAGLALVHTGLGIAGTGYISVTTSDPGNVSLVDGNITWMWSPTYPVPMLGTSTSNPQLDYTLRTQIEQSYSRPVTIPFPNYVVPSPTPTTTPPVTGWWAELYGKAAATITVTASASGQLPSHAGATITPAAAATGYASGTAGATITPVGAAVGYPTVFGAATTTVTPAAAAAGHLTFTGTAAATVTLTAAAAGSGSGTAAATITPSVSAAGLLTPSYDFSAKSALQSALASGTPFTWSSGGGTAGAYGIVFVECKNAVMNLTATATVTWGGITMTSLGNKYNNNSSVGGWGWVFILNGIPSGAQTISVTLTQAGQTFTGYGSSYSYNNVSSVGVLQTASGSSSPTLSVTAANPTDIVWGAIVSNNFVLTGFSLTTRQNSAGVPVFSAGDTTGSTSVTVSGTSSTPVWSAFGLDLK